MLFRAPEYRKVLVLALTPAELASAIEISDADLKKGYEERKARYATPERRHLQQIVFPNMEEAKAAADKLAKGTTFAALAAERGLKDADTDLGTLTKTAMVDRAVADAAFALKEGEVSAPVEGRFGIVLVQVDKIEPASTKPFEEVAAELKQEMAAERAKAELLTVHDKIEDERLGGATLADLAKKLNLQTRTIEAIDRAGQDRDGKPVADLPQGRRSDQRGVSCRSRLRQRSAARSAARRLCLVRRHGHHAGARPHARRGQGPARDALARRPDRVAAQGQGRRDARQAQGRHAVRGSRRGRSSSTPEWRPGLKRGNPPPGIPARALDEIFRNARRIRPPAPKAPRRRIAWCSASPRSPCRRWMPSRPTPSASTMLLRRAIADDMLAQYVVAAGNGHRRHHQSGRAQPDHRRQSRKLSLRHADRAAGRAPSRTATRAARRRWCGPRWSPISRRRSRPS